MSVILQVFEALKNLTEILLQSLDPSLFQNITLGILAIFIPFVIVFLTDILSSKEKKKTQFEKMVLSDEVFGTKKVFWLAIFGIFFFSFFSGTNISITAKLICLLIVVIIIWEFYKPFKKLLKFSEGDKHQFEKSFLKKLNFSKLPYLSKSNNIKIANKMVKSWQSIWYEENINNEREFIEIFISHIDKAMASRKFELAIQLSQTYITNIKKRNLSEIGIFILPKIIEWDESLLGNSEIFFDKFKNKKINKKRKIRKLLSLSESMNFNKNTFHNWHFFRRSFLEDIIKSAIQSNYFVILSDLKIYIEEKSLDKYTTKVSKYQKLFLKSFFRVFFDEVYKTKYMSWDYEFPNDWKITIKNRNNRISHLILFIFIELFQSEIFKKTNDEYNRNLTEIISNIFPTVCPMLFKAFILLYFSGENIKYATENGGNFFIINSSGVTWYSSENETKKDRKEKIQKLFSEQEATKKRETTGVILNYFGNYWRVIRYFKEDLSKEENESWRNLSSKEKENTIKRVRISKLTKLKNTINDNEIKEYCKESKLKEYNRKSFLELVELLINELNK
ncbi:hypothetical protein [Francisella sp. 19X1-34]|uniref:hypothetical protein n=1 Tax=Francisella sp. 19X1-34 TaxID=3087177 RepID=UPI002E347608|nr:hypothetical protein [Francisella sp. 19X1-34]MED7789366.1 hypothetical protein [Francisella sp. 19X1-34]